MPPASSSLPRSVPTSPPRLCQDNRRILTKPAQLETSPGVKAATLAPKGKNKRVASSTPNSPPGINTGSGTASSAKKQHVAKKGMAQKVKKTAPRGRWSEEEEESDEEVEPVKGKAARGKAAKGAARKRKGGVKDVEEAAKLEREGEGMVEMGFDI